MILAREAGYCLEQSDVEKNLFVPDDFFEGSLDDFWKKVPSLDADFEARRKVLEAENKHWRFVAKLEMAKHLSVCRKSAPTIRSTGWKAAITSSC